MVVIRRYQRQDQEAVWNLHEVGLRHAGAYAGHGPWDRDLRAIEQTCLHCGGEFLVGVEQGRLIAMGGLRPRGPRVAEIRRMRVLPRHQRQGIGRRLLAGLESRARELGFEELRLDTSVQQHAAISLYRAEGYQETGIVQRHGFTLILFTKRFA